MKIICKLCSILKNQRGGITMTEIMLTAAALTLVASIILSIIYPSVQLVHEKARDSITSIGSSGI